MDSITEETSTPPPTPPTVAVAASSSLPAPPHPPPAASSSTTTTATTPRSSLKCLRCSCHGSINLSTKSITSNCFCLCCHLQDSSCVYCGIDQCIECHEKYYLQFDENNNFYFSCQKHCHHQKSAFSDNFNSLSRHRINQRIPPTYKTLLHTSVLADDSDLTWDLLLKGANPFICDANGATPIDLAKLLRSGKIQSDSLNERRIFDILPKISYPDSSVELPTDARLRTQSDCGPEIPNSFTLSPKKPRMKKQHLRTEQTIIQQPQHHHHEDPHQSSQSPPPPPPPSSSSSSHHKKQKSPRRKSKPFNLTVTTEFTYRPQFNSSVLENSLSPPSATPPSPPPPPLDPHPGPAAPPSSTILSPKPIKKKRSMTMTLGQYPPVTPRAHIHNNTFSKTTSNILTKKERAMTFTENEGTSSVNIAPNTSLTPLSYGYTRRERAQTITDTSPKKNKIIKNGKIISTSWDTNDDFVSKRPLLRGLVQSGYRLAISNAPDLLKGKQVFTPMTLLKLSSDNNEISNDEYSLPHTASTQQHQLHQQGHHNYFPYQPSMSTVKEGEIENDNSMNQNEKMKQLPLPDEWIQWEISQFQDMIITENEIDMPLNPKKTPSRTPSALTSRTGSYTDMSNLEKERNTSQLNASTSGTSATLPSTIQSPTPVRSLVQGVASRPNASSPLLLQKSRINLGNITSNTSATPPPLAPDASGDEVANAFTAFAQSMTTSSAATPPLLPKHLKIHKLTTPTTTSNTNTPPPQSPAVISEMDERSNYDNVDSIDISSLDPQPPLMEEILLTCTGCYDELPSSQMVYTCSRMGCMSHLCQECIFRSVFVTITSALYAVPRIKCPGRCMHAIPTRIWRGILRGMKISDEDKLTIKVEDQYPILRLLDLLYESFELFCGDYERVHSVPLHQNLTDLDLKYIHMCDMLKKIETILIQDGYSLNELYNTVYELNDKGKDSDKDSDEDEDSEDDEDSDEEEDEEDESKILSNNFMKINITTFNEFAQLVYPKKTIPDSDLEKSFLLMEDILNDSEIESNRLGVKKIRKLRLCVFVAHAAVIIRTRLDPTVISSDYVSEGSYVMNIYHNDAESLLIKKYIHNANALLTIRCGGCDDTVSLYHTIENGKILITEKGERERVLKIIVSQLQSSTQSLTTNSNIILLFLRNWINFITHRIPAVTFISNIIRSYLNSLIDHQHEKDPEKDPKDPVKDPVKDSKIQAIETQLELGVLPTELMKYLDQIISLILDAERRFAAQLEIYRRYPKIRVPCCDTKHCFLCKIQGHHKTKTCSEIQNTERGLNCQYCPGCGVATLRTEGCTEILCVCGAVWKWKSDEKKGKQGNAEEKGEGDENDENEESDEDSDEDEDEDSSSSSSDSWDDDSDESDD